MTVNPNDIETLKDKPLRVERKPYGIYSVKNVYSGNYEYFRNRILPPITSSSNK